jgi:formate dehydrogenase (coenzyme F420) alpha subunit
VENLHNSKTVRTMCPLCNYHLLDVTVANNKVLDVKTSPTPGNKGDAVCAKAVHGLKWHYQDARVAYPMVRQGKRGPWARASWDEALDIVAGELKRVKTVYGSQATANIIGGGSIMGGIMAMYGAGNFARQYGCFCHTHGETCYIVRVIAHMFTFGCLLNSDLDPAAKHGSMWFWGSNPSACCPPMVPRIRKKKKDGAKVVVIDPVQIPIAKDADLHLRPRPGTDLALALAMMNVIIEQNLYDKEFVNNYTVGFEDLKRHVARYRPEFMEDVVNIPASDIREAAEMFAKHQPVSLMQNIGIDGNAHSFQCLRAIAMLHALMGNVDRQGGMLQVFPWSGFVASSAFSYLEGVPCAGDDSLYTKSVNQGSTARFLEPLLEGKPCSYKALMIAGYNPVRQHGDINQVKKALEKAEFICQIDVQFNETSEYADVFLPARVGLEKQELGTLWGTLDLDPLSTLEPCIEAPGEALDDWEIWWRLTDKFGFSRPWKTYEEAADDILKVTGFTLEKLRKEGEWYAYPKDGPFEKWRSQPFNTPSGKAELYSKALEELGYDPIPTWREPPETPKSDPILAKTYPLTAIDRRSPHYMHSRLFDCPALRKLEPEALALINPRDAEKYGISDNDMIVIESLRGAIEMRAKVNDIMEGVISLSMGFPEACSNYLTGTGSPLYDTVVGGDRLRGYLVRIRRKE